ncbi:hypothetical protein [Granulicoccus sp. GXG6511]|uniref:hypothetical protein n=1 Tax=Granulicoccus sp. GXG6511 TaxID=3381351 RepID=UPI003D7E4218
MRRILQGRGLGLGAVVATVLGLVAGAALAGQLSNALAIRFENKTVPAEEPANADHLDVQPLAALGRITAPAAFLDHPRTQLAERLLRAAVDNREPLTTAAPVDIEVVIESTEGISPGGDEAYSLHVTDSTLTIRAASGLGATNGLFRVADQLAAGHDWRELDTDGEVRPALGERFVDTGAVGVRPNPDAYRAQDDYQHSSGALEDVVLADAPYVDPAALDRVAAEWREHVDHAVAYGYNGVIINGFLEYVNFDRLGDGFEVYPADSPYRARHDAMKREVGGMWRYAHDMGMHVVFKSDMLALTGPLEAYLDRETGLDPTDPRLWEVYRAGFDEFFGDFDWVDGFMIRIGEGGSIYNHRGWDYYSALKVTDAAGVRTMLDVTTSIAAEHDATIYFRTWSVGVGDVGDMHTNPETYDRLLGDFSRPNLVVSTKFVMGDFDSWLPLNPTLSTGSQRRLVEMQGRREFEAFSSIPNDVGPLHQTALQTFRRDNPNVDALWMWTQDGGPWRAGPMSLYLKAGNWKLYDLNVYAGARLAWDPEADLDRVNGDWIRRAYSRDPDVVAAVGAVLAESRAAVLDGLYIGPYAEQQVFALGLEPPPMMWIFKWDIVSGDSAALSAVYVATRGRVDEAIAAGERAVGTAERMRAELARVDRAAFSDPADYDRLVESVDYEVDLLRTLQAYRVLVLRYYEWLDTGNAEAEQAWRAALPVWQSAVAEHERRWTGNLDLPPFNFFAAEAGMAYAERVDVMRLAAGALLLLALLGIAFVPGLRRGAFTPWAGSLRRAEGSRRVGSLRAESWFRSLRRAEGSRVRSLRRAEGPSRREKFPHYLTLALPAVVAIGSQVLFTAGRAPWYLLLSLGFLGLFALTARGVLAWLKPGADGSALWSAMGGSWLLGAILFLGAVAVRGPGAYWFRFWTDDTTRGWYLTAAVGLAVWWLAAVVTGVASGYGVKVRQGVGAVLLGLGVPLAVVGAGLGIAGLERGLTTLNDELALLPLGLSRILGLTVHLGIPQSLPAWLGGLGMWLSPLGQPWPPGLVVRSILRLGAQANPRYKSIGLSMSTGEASVVVWVAALKNLP